MRKLTFKPWSIPIALLVIIILAFGLLIGGLGFYQDDWYLVWMGLRNGPQVFLSFFAGSRPFLAGIYMLTTQLVGESMLAWQVFALLTRWFTALAAWWALKQLWPGRVKEITWIAILFAIYPAFKQHFVAVVYSNAYIALAAFLFSLGAMLKAARQAEKRWLLTILGTLGAIFSLVTTEYFFGLELFRPLMLWFLFSQEKRSIKERVRLVMLHWALYLTVTVVFLVWRVFFFSSYMYGPELTKNLSSSPVDTVFYLFQTLVQDGLEASIFAWLQTFDFAKTIYPDLRTMAINWGIVILAGVAVGLYLFKLQINPGSNEKQSAQPEHEEDQFGWQALGLGVYSILITGWPFWYAGLSVELASGADRFTLSYMFGAALLVVGLLELLIKNDRGKIVIISGLVGAAILFQIRNAQTYQEAHQVQAALFRQLSWRAPGLVAGTNLLLNDMPVDYTGNASMNAAFDWVYLAEPKSDQPDFQLLFVPFRIGSPELPALEPGPGTENSLVATYTPPGCVQIIDPAVHGDLPRLSEAIEQAAPFSRLELIIPDSSTAATNYQSLFGKADTQDWCYYFEKADLARQLGNWAEIVRLGDQAFAAGRGPYEKYSTELLPFIEGYGRSENWERAIQLTRSALSDIPALQESLCDTWQRIDQATPTSAEKSSSLEKVQKELNCTRQ